MKSNSQTDQIPAQSKPTPHVGEETSLTRSLTCEEPGIVGEAEPHVASSGGGWELLVKAIGEGPERGARLLGGGHQGRGHGICGEEEGHLVKRPGAVEVHDRLPCRGSPGLLVVEVGHVVRARKRQEFSWEWMREEEEKGQEMGCRVAKGERQGRRRRSDGRTYGDECFSIANGIQSNRLYYYCCYSCSD